MKKTIFVALTFAIFSMFWGISQAAEWYLYDNFDSGETIDPNRWDIQSAANINITIEEGRAKFVHYQGSLNNSGFLVFNQSPESIKAVRLNLSVMGQQGNCSGDVRGRVAVKKIYGRTKDFIIIKGNYSKESCGKLELFLFEN